MNKNINKLYALSAKSKRLIIGLMSGTSMDGLDIALCEVSGSGTETNIKLIKFKTAGYSDIFREQIKSIFSRHDADLQMVCLMNAVIGKKHAQLINDALKEWGIENADIDLIASHGQSIFHAPASLHKMIEFPNATLQIGDGDHIAVDTSIITISDFRQKHIAAGGEGAPLAVYGDFLLFTKKGEDRVLLNIGGIANFTFLPSDADAGKVFSTDVGPGNTLMDQFAQHYFGLYYDEGAAIALSGKLNQPLLEALLNNSFFAQGFPKTTGPELFNLNYLIEAQEISNTKGINNEDIMSTLCHLSSFTIVDAIQRCFKNGETPNIYMSGGGMHNPLLVRILKEKLPEATFYTTDDLNILPDAKEAVLFAILANETVAGGPVDFGNRQGIPAITMGKISFPD